MKVVHIVHSLFEYSGASNQAYNLAMSMKKGALTQEFFSISSDGDKPIPEGRKDFKVYQTRGTVISRILNFMKMYLSYKPDIAHFHGADFLLLVLCRLFSVKIYWKSTLYGSDDFESLCNGKFGFLKTKLINLVDINNSLTYQIFNKNRGYLSKGKIVIIPNGVLVGPLNKSRKKLAIIIGAVIKRKNTLKGIDFFKKELEPHGYKLLIIGPYEKISSEYDDDYCSQCLSYASKNLLFLGKLDQEKVKEYLSDSNFLIHLSQKEGMPNVVLEALASGVYPIVTDMEGLAKEIVEHNVTGFNIDAQDVFNVSNFQGTNKHGYKYCIESLSFTIVSDLTINVYRKMLVNF